MREEYDEKYVILGYEWSRREQIFLTELCPSFHKDQVS